MTAAYQHVRVETPYGFGDVVAYDCSRHIASVRLAYGVAHVTRNALLSSPPNVPGGVLVATLFGGGTVVRRRDDGVYVVAMTASPGPPMAYLQVRTEARTRARVQHRVMHSVKRCLRSAKSRRRRTSSGRPWGRRTLCARSDSAWPPLRSIMHPCAGWRRVQREEL